MKAIQDIETLDIIFADSFPKEINKAKIKEVFEILQSQERPDLVKEMKTLILLKTTGEIGTKPDEEKIQETDLAKEMKNLVQIKNCGEKSSNLAEEKRIDISSPINQVLPTEMLKKILEKLHIRSLIIARQTCMRWKEIIDKFKFVEEASSKFLKMIT